MFAFIQQVVMHYRWVWFILLIVSVVIATIMVALHIMITEVSDDDSEFQAQPRGSVTLFHVSLVFLILGGLSFVALVSSGVVWLTKSL
jgi:hypothetical protein